MCLIISSPIKSKLSKRFKRRKGRTLTFWFVVEEYERGEYQEGVYKKGCKAWLSPFQKTSHPMSGVFHSDRFSKKIMLYEKEVDKGVNEGKHVFLDQDDATEVAKYLVHHNKLRGEWVEGINRMLVVSCTAHIDNMVAAGTCTLDFPNSISLVKSRYTCVYLHNVRKIEAEAAVFMKVTIGEVVEAFTEENAIRESIAMKDE